MKRPWARKAGSPWADHADRTVAPSVEERARAARAQIGEQPTFVCTWPLKVGGKLYLEPFAEEYDLSQGPGEVRVWMPDPGTVVDVSVSVQRDGHILMAVDGVHYEVYRDQVLVECRLF